MNPNLPPTRRALRCLLPVLAVALISLAPVPASAGPKAVVPVSAAATSVIDTSSRAAVAAAYRNVYLPAVAVRAPTPSPDDIAACQAGSPSNELQDATLQLVNYFRGMSQVPAVTFEPTLSAKAQQAALMMYANGELDDQPPSTWSCYSADGAEAAGSSNLGLGYAGADVVAGYMTDDTSSNTEAGHRWWLQRPAARVMGSGTVGTANVLWVFPDDADVATTEPAFTSWPSAGYFPAPLQPSGRWSFSPTDLDADLSAATVSMTVDGTAVRVTSYPIGRFPDLVFEFAAMAAPTGSAVTTYDVTVSGVRVDGQPVAPYQYSVRMFDPSYTPPPPLPPFSAVTRAKVKGHAVVGSTLAAVSPEWNRTGVRTSFQWLRDKKAITGATKKAYKLATADIGHRFSVRVTGRTAGKRAASTSTQTAKVTKVRSTLSVRATSPAVGRVRLAVGLTTGGSGVTGVVRVLDGRKTVARALKVVRGHAVYSAKAKPGRHRYTVSYAGTARVTSARSAVAITVRDKVAAHLTASAKSSAPNTVTFRVTVRADGQRSLGGSVRISRGAKTVVKKLAVHHGSARYTAKKQPKGKQRYTVTYSGTASVKKAAVKRTVRVRAPLRIVSYGTCDAMDADYPHGVGKSGATDSTSGTPVTDFFRSNALYAANDGGTGEHDLDRDNDGIACER